MSQENRIYIWLIVVLLFAAAFRYFRYSQIKDESEAFLLQKDSLFYQLKAKSDSVFASLDSANTSHPNETVSIVKVNINRADLEQLTVIPGIGSKMAQRIIDYRIQHGPFKRVEDLIRIKGIGEKKLAKMRQWVVIKKVAGSD